MTSKLIASRPLRPLALALALLATPALSPAQPYLDNQTQYSNQDPDTETRRSDHFRMCFGHYDRDGGMSEAMAQGNLQMFEGLWQRNIVELGLNDLGQSAILENRDGNNYRANFNFLMTWNDGGGGGAYMGMDGKGFSYAMANPGYCRWDPPSGATPHEMGHAWEGQARGFNGSDSSGPWWEGTANWFMLQLDNTYPTDGIIYNGMYYPMHGRDYYGCFTIWEGFREDPRYGPGFINNVWTNVTPDQQAHEWVIDRMVRLDSSGSPDKAGASRDMWGMIGAKRVTWDFERQKWFAVENHPESDPEYWSWYQRCRTPLVPVPGTNGWYRPPRQHIPMQYGFDIIPLTATPGTTVTCRFQPLCDPIRGSDWRACLVAVSTNLISTANPNPYASYSTLWNCGANSMTLSPDQTQLYLVVSATPTPNKIYGLPPKEYLRESGLQFPYAVSFTNATPRNVIYARPGGGTWKSHQNPDGTVCRNIASGATVADTAYVGTNAMVLDSAQVLDNAQVLDYAVVRHSAQVRDSAIVSGHAVVQDTAQVYGHAKVRDWARVFGNAQVFENAKVIEHANCGDNGTSVSGCAVIKGTTYVYSPSTFNGGFIMDGDSANGSADPISHGVHFGWGWGPQPSMFADLADNNYQFCSLAFENTPGGITNNPVFALDTLGINHGYLMNGCRPAVDAGASVRGGYVLPLQGNQYVELHPSVNDFKDTTIALSVKWTGRAAGQRIWSMGDGAAKQVYLAANDTDTGGLRLVITDGTTTQTVDGPALPVNTWTHLAVTFSSLDGTCYLYVNGTAVAGNYVSLFPDSLNAPLMNNANYLGRGNAGNYFQGSVDEFAVYMRTLADYEIAGLYNIPAPAAVTAPVDTTAPTPNPPAWVVNPVAISDCAIAMSAPVGADASGWVEYYFACTSGGGHDSGWVSFHKYTDCGLTPNTTYTYTVRMRDQNGNTTAVSSPGSATTRTSSAGTASFAYGPVGIADGQITMTATVVTNASGKTEYKFDRSGKSSGWLGAPAWTDTGLSAGGTYTYTVTVRDGRGNTSAPSTGVTARARDEAAPLLPIKVAQWTTMPYATIDNKISMTAMDATDPAGVQYYFQCTAGGAPDSGWQNSPVYTTPALADGTYAFRYKLRDKSAQANESAWSATALGPDYKATIKPTTGYHSYPAGQVPALPDDTLVSFVGAVMRVNANNYIVKDPVTGTNITVKPSSFGEVTDPAVAAKSVLVKGHLYTLSGSRIVTYASVTALSNAATFTISGKVSSTNGTPIAGATIYVSDAAHPVTSPIFKATADANGNYSVGVVSGTWYVAAEAGAFNTSADQVVTVANSNASGVNFALVSNARAAGMVVRRRDGQALPGATVYFSRTSGALANAIYTTTTDANGMYIQSLQDGLWYLCATASGYDTSPDQTVTMNSVDQAGVNLALDQPVAGLLWRYPLDGNLQDYAGNNTATTSGGAITWLTSGTPARSLNPSGAARFPVGCQDNCGTGTFSGPNGDFTIAWWMRNNVVNAAYQSNCRLMNKGGWGSAFCIEFKLGQPINAPAGFSGFLVNSANGTYAAKYNLPNNEWHHLAITYSGADATATLWVDGLAQETWSTTFPAQGNQDVFWGNPSSWQNGSANGGTVDMDDVRFFSAALAPADVASLLWTTPTQPIVTTQAAGSVNWTSATLNATVNPNGVPPVVSWFQYGLTATYGSVTGLATNNSTGPVSATVNGLVSGATYHFRAVATNASGFGYGADQTFVTPAALYATTLAADMIAATTARLNGLVNPSNTTATAWFEYGPDTTYGSVTAPINAGSGSTGVPVSSTVNGLTALTTYHFRAVATNVNGRVYGPDQMFATVQPLYVATGNATGITTNGAVLSGVINPSNTVSSAWFQYGTTTNYGFTTPATSVAAGSSVVPVSRSITGLASTMLHHFRIVGSNANGVLYGSDQVFTTLTPPPSAALGWWYACEGNLLDSGPLGNNPTTSGGTVTWLTSGTPPRSLNPAKAIRFPMGAQANCGTGVFAGANGDWSMSFWLRYDMQAATYANNCRLMNKGGWGSAFCIEFKVGQPTQAGSPAGYSGFLINSANGTHTATYDLPYNEWHHIDLTYSAAGSGLTTMYVDSVSVDSWTGLYPVQGNQSVFWGYPSSWSNGLGGPGTISMDDVRFYSIALSASDVTGLLVPLTADSVTVRAGISGTDVVLNFNTTVGFKYKVAYSSVLPAASWSNYITPTWLSGTGTSLQVRDTGVLTGGQQRYYRVEVAPGP